MRKFILLGSLLAVSMSATANDAIKYTCTMSNTERVIEVVYASSDKPVPCSVSYTKDGTSQTLWNYENTEGQCEAKAAEFAEKQNSWGFNCSSKASSETTEATASAQ
ncbi:hypothetical protein [Cellvibrio sp. OA-2007]|uniref:hypothetical protein n=1 Tax=Cellvibrio sp. OA-2007 TaxID=529823 RepID=UPI000782B30F|nr:hypothetical protein [Cellvibrio sp. OA-2007]